MKPVARQALTIACWCGGGFLVAVCAAVVVSMDSLDTHSLAESAIAVGLYLLGMWLGLSALFITLCNWEEWWKP